MRIRRNVETLDPEGPELTWYAKAVEILLGLPLTDPTGWRFMAAVHGVPPVGGDPYAIPGEAQPTGAQKAFWDQCQHQTWYFLPWHRGYVAAFEGIVAEVIAAQGGPEWSLPYWDYSAQPASRIMPAAFCRKPVAGGRQNFLWNEWGRTDDGDMGLADGDVSLECLDHGVFAGAAIGGEQGFAGPVSKFAHFGSRIGLPNGRIEEVPHNQVHGQIGGLMGDPRYAALDPIFWLHHANIDRLWEVWRRRYPDLANVTDKQWLSDEKFKLHRKGGQLWEFTPAEMLDTTTVLDGYTYDDVGAAVAAPAILAVGDDEVTEIERTPAELAGATSKPIAIANGVGAATFAVRQTPGPIPMGLLRDGAGGGRVFLNLENIAGRGDSANYDVFLAGADHPEAPLRAGQISLFGLEEATDLKTGEGGLNKVLDITGIADQLGLTSDGELQLAIRLQRRPRRTDATPARDRGEPKLEVGRASIYFTE